MLFYTQKNHTEKSAEFQNLFTTMQGRTAANAAESYGVANLVTVSNPCLKLSWLLLMTPNANVQSSLLPPAGRIIKLNMLTLETRCVCQK